MKTCGKSARVRSVTIVCENPAWSKTSGSNHHQGMLDPMPWDLVAKIDGRLKFDVSRVEQNLAYCGPKVFF